MAARIRTLTTTRAAKRVTRANGALRCTRARRSPTFFTTTLCVASLALLTACSSSPSLGPGVPYGGIDQSRMKLSEIDRRLVDEQFDAKLQSACDSIRRQEPAIDQRLREIFGAKIELNEESVGQIKRILTTYSCPAPTILPRMNS